MELATSQMVHFIRISPQDMTLEPVLIFLYPLLEQMPTTTPFFHTSRFWNSLPPYVVEAPSNLV